MSMVFSIKFLSGAWAEVSRDRKRKFCGRSVGWDWKYCRDCERGESEICDELTKLVSAVSTNQIEAFGAKTLKISGIGDSENCDSKCEENVSCDQISKLRIEAADFPSSWATLPGENIWEISDLNVVEFLGPIFHRAANFILLERLLGWLVGRAAFAKMGRRGGR